MGGFRQAHPEPRKESSSLKDDGVMTLRPVSQGRRKPCQSLEMGWDGMNYGVRRGLQVKPCQVKPRGTQSEEETRGSEI